MYFNKNLRFLRKIKDWSQETIADKLGYKSFTTVQKWESGDSEPPMSTVRMICSLFNIPMEQILNFDLEKLSDNVIKNITHLRDDRYHTGNSISKHLNIADSLLSEWENGNSKTYMFFLSEIADFFGITINSLLGVEPLGMHINEETLPYGNPIKINDIIKDHISEPDLPPKGETFGLVVRDNTMEPQIFDGDIVMVRRQDNIENNSFAVVLVDGETATVKKVVKQENGILLVGLNTEAFSPIFYSQEEIDSLPVKFLGKVVEVRRTFE